MPNTEFEVAYRKIQDSDIPNKRAYARMFTADALSDTPDKQGRVLIPAKLREYAGLGENDNREITVIGAGSHIELWATDAWEAYQAANVELYATMTEGVF
jgi:MraZ protein